MECRRIAAASRNPVTEEDLEHLIREMAWAITTGFLGIDNELVLPFADSREGPNRGEEPEDPVECLASEFINV
jgi:hypothetical protein